MKQKLPEKKSSYKNLYLGERQKKEILSNSLTKYSLSRLLIAILFDVKNFIHLFDFRMVTLSRDLRNSRNKKIFVINTLMLFVLPLFISISYSTCLTVVEQNNVGLTKFKRKNHRGINCMGIYIKSFINLNKNFANFPYNFFIMGYIEKQSKNVFLENIPPIFFKKIIFEKNSFEREKKDSISELSFSKNFFTFYICAKEIINRDSFKLKKKILQNLRNWGESDRVLIKSIFLSKEKRFSNYMKNLLWQFSKKNFRGLEHARQKVYTEKNLKSFFYSELNNPELFITLENDLSDSIFKFSRYLSHEAGKFYDSHIINTNCFTKKLNIDPISRFSDEKVEKNEKFFNCINFDDSNSSKEDGSEFMKKGILNIGNKLLIKPVFIQTISKKKPRLFFDFSKNRTKSHNNKYILKNLFSPQEIQKVNSQKFIHYRFFEAFLIDDFNQNISFKKNFSKILKKRVRVRYLKKNVESDDTATISWKIWKYHSNFLLTYSVPLNIAYNMIRHNYSTNEILNIYHKESNQVFFKIFHFLSPSFFKFQNFFLFVNQIHLEEHLIEKNNELILLLEKFNGKKYPKFFEKFLFFSILNRKIDTKNNSFLFIDNTIQTKFFNFYNSIQKSLKKLLNNIYLKKNLFFDSENIYIIHTFLIPSKINIKKSFILNIGNIEYNKFILQIYESFNQINNLKIFQSSKEYVPDLFLIKKDSPKIFERFYRKPNSEYIQKTSNYLRIFINISNKENVEQVQLLNKFYKSFINKILITNFNSNERNIKNFIPDSWITEMGSEICRNFLNKSFSFQNSLESIQSKKIFYNEPVFFYSEKLYIEKNYSIYLQFLKNFLKYNKINSIFIEIKSLFLRNKIIYLAELRLTNFLLSKRSYENYDKTKILSLFNFYKKLLKSLKNFSLLISSKLSAKQGKNKIKTISYYEFLKKNFSIEINSKKIVSSYFVPKLKKIKIENYHHILRYESLKKSEKRNSQIFQLINNIFLYPRSMFLKLKNLEYKAVNKILKNTDKVYKYNQLEIYSFFMKNLSFKNYNYTLWVFTSEWWEYNIHIFVETFRKIFLIIRYHLEYFIKYYVKDAQKNLLNLWEKRKNLYNLSLKKNSRLFLNFGEKISKFIWPDFQILNNWKNLNWAVFSLIVFIYLFYQNFFAILIGSDLLDLWKYFEIIKYLTDTSRAFYFTKLLHRNNTQLNKTENFLIHFFSNLKYYVRNFRFFLLTKKNLTKLLKKNKSLDLSRRKRNLLVQSLITHTRITDYGFQPYIKQKLLTNGFVYWGDNQQGISYFQYLIWILRKNLINYSLYLADKWIFFASVQKIISSQTLWQIKRLNPRFQKIPVPLQFGLSCSKGILLIGPVETGRSYLIKNLAADSYVPLLGIYINKLLYNKPDVITESWVNILIESLRRLNLTLDLAKGMSPCIIWIRNLHQLDVNRSTENIESDPTFLLGILLKHFQLESTKSKTKNNIIIIGATHLPKKVDPSLISPDRLERIINIRLFNMSQRKNLFPILLNKKSIKLKKSFLHFTYFEYRTMGYNMRDLAALTNEISLISLTKNESFTSTDTIKLAFHRQIFGFTHTNNKPNFQRNLKILLYKIGRAVIQNILIEGSVTNLLNISNYLWKRKFYYLSKWYSEPSIDESIVKESTIIVYVLSCLAGVAARDSWFFSEENPDTSIPLDKSVENDLDLAFSILENFSVEFPWLETCKTRFLNSKQRKSETFSTKNFLSIMQNGIFAIANRSFIYSHKNSEYESLISRHKIIEKISCEFKETAWSPRFWRLNFSRSYLFDWIKKPNDFEFFQNLDKKNHYNKSLDKEKEQFIYERILPRVRKRNVQELESQFEEILLQERFEILGSCYPSTQYNMEYQLNKKPRFFIGKRILWDPTGSFSRIRHFVFSRREFFVDEEMLRRLYITYGVRRERERSLSSHRIKRFFIYRGYNKDLINKLSIRWWNQLLPMNQKQNIYTLKHIENIGIQLKRPQIFTPVYLYQRWLIENIPEKFSRLNLFTHRDRWLKINHLLLNDSFTYMTLLESYQYLFEFFLSNNKLLNRITKILLKKKWIFQNEIGDIINDIKKC